MNDETTPSNEIKKESLKMVGVWNLKWQHHTPHKDSQIVFEIDANIGSKTCDQFVDSLLSCLSAGGNDGGFFADPASDPILFKTRKKLQRGSRTTATVDALKIGEIALNAVTNYGGVHVDIEGFSIIAPVSLQQFCL
jgi:hypothetical protein